MRSHKEKRIQDYERDKIELPNPKEYGTPPFTSEKEARRYLKAIANFSDKDMTRLLAWYLPTLFECGCPNSHEDSLYGTGNRSQYVCDGFYRCRSCGFERNPDGSKHVRKQRVTDVDLQPEKLDNKQLSLLDWKDNEY